MSKSTHQIAVTGVDKTAKAFSSIQARAIATGNRIASVMGGAIAAAGAYLSFRSIKAGIDELGRLDDIAAKTKTNVSELSQAVSGFQILGINTSVESFAKTLDFMRKNTGREGMAGFYQTVEEIGKIPDSAERAKKAVAAFGDSGMELMPIIDNANKGVEAIRGVVDAMPSIPDEAAKAGDAVNDAMTIAGEGFHSIWLETLGAVSGMFDSIFVGGIRQAAHEGVAWLRFWAKSSVPIIQGTWRRIRGYGSAVGGAVGAWVGASFEQRGTQGEVWKLVKDAWNSELQEMEDDLEGIMEPTSKLGEQLQAALDKARNFGLKYKSATEGNSNNTPSGKSAAPTAEAIEEATAKAATRIANQLVMGGSNEARRIGVLGPSYQNEQKKQTEYLKKIAVNTSKTADNTEEGYSATDL